MMRIIAIHQQQQAILFRQVGEIGHGHHAVQTLGDDLELGREPNVARRSVHLPDLMGFPLPGDRRCGQQQQSDRHAAEAQHKEIRLCHDPQLFGLHLGSKW